MQGVIGKYKLEDWWNKEFAAEERTTIQAVFAPMSSDGTMDGILTSGNGDFADSCFEFLTILLNWFHKPEYYSIITKIINLADSMLSTENDVTKKHFYFLQKIRAYYPCRDQFPEALELAIKACEEQISISQDAAKTFKKEGGIPEHTGFKQLCIIREKQGNWEEVIRLAEQAKSEGWSDGTAGGWDKRIEKARKKLGKAQ